MSELNEAQQEARFFEGYDAGWEQASEAEFGMIGDPVGVDEFYDMGYWNGVGDCCAWNEGWRAAELGILFCPYLLGADDECFRSSWLHGYTSHGESMAGSMCPSKFVN